MSNQKKYFFVGTFDHKHSIVFGGVNDVWEKGTTQSRSIGYDSEAELREGEGILPEPCKHCGEMVSTNYNEETKKRLTDKNLCHSCDFWFAVKETLNEPDRFVVNHIAYRVKPDVPKGRLTSGFIGFGGAEFKFQDTNGTITISHNVWSNGEVPECFYDLIPDNAILIK